MAAFFHTIFKVLAVLTFVICALFDLSYIGMFVSVTIFLAVDFWIQKNVSGRLMVGLRWWNRIKDDGESEWIFECHPLVDSIHPFDTYFFWALTYGHCVVWVVLLIFYITSISKLPMVLLALVLSGANALGYTKCRRDLKKRGTQFIGQQVMKNPGLVASAM